MRIFLLYIFLSCYIIASAQKAVNPVLFEAKALASQNKYEDAIQILIKEKSPGIESLKLVGNCFYQLGKYESSLQYYSKADSISLNSASYEIARCYAITGNSEKACFWLKKNLTGKNKRSEYEINNDKAFDPISKTKEWSLIWQNEWYTTSEIEIFAIKALLKRGDIKVAYEQLDKNRDVIYPKSELYYIEASILKEIDQPEAALNSINLAIERNNRNDSYYLKKSEILNKQKKYVESVACISKAIDINPNEPEYYILRSKTSLLAGNYTQSQNDLNLYGKYFPQNTEFLHCSAKLESGKGNYLNALEYYTLLLNTDKSNPVYYTERGEAAFKAGRYEMADEDMSIALDYNPNSDTANLIKGKTKLYFNDIPSACYYLGAAARLKNEEALKLLRENCK